ncbi:unnamed protein product [Urochloa humidicola]
MAVPRVILRRLRGHQAGLRRGVPAIGRRRPRSQLLIDSGRVLMLLGALVLVHQLSTSAPAVRNEAGAEHVLLLVLGVGFLLWLLGVAVTMLSLVAGQFHGLLAAVVAAIALALRVYLFGGV